MYPSTIDWSSLGTEQEDAEAYPFLHHDSRRYRGQTNEARIDVHEPLNVLKLVLDAPSSSKNPYNQVYIWLSSVVPSR
jgi:hypothetical protein